MKELFVVLLFIVMLVGVPHTLTFINPLSIIGTMTVASLYIVGFLGLETFYKSLCYRDRKKRLLALFFGLFCMLIVYFSLETLLTGR